MLRTSLLIAMTAIAVLPLAAAQVPLSEFSITASSPATYLDPASSTELDVSATIGCGLILQAGEQSEITLTAAGPEWLTTESATIPIGLADCAGDEDATITKNGTIAVKPTGEAPGLTTFAVDIQASFADAGGSASTADATVEGLAIDYVPGHTLSPAGDQRFEVTEDDYTFDLAIDIEANARTMVMFENRVVTGGTLGGLAHKVFEVPTGETSTTYTISWTPPDREWTEETVTFYNYSHCLDRDGCDPTNEANPTWTFVNAAPHDDSDGHHDEESKGIPAPGIPILLVGVASIAWAARRR